VQPCSTLFFFFFPPAQAKIIVFHITIWEIRRS
jgi:hypothetical protein